MVSENTDPRAELEDHTKKGEENLLIGIGEIVKCGKDTRGRQH